MVAGVRVDTHDKWVGISDDGHGDHGTFPRVMDMVQRPSQAGISPVGVTSEQHCDGSRPPRGGQSSDQATEVGRTVTGRPPRKMDKSTARHSNVHDCMSHIFGGGAAGSHPASQSRTSHDQDSQ
jgi:hypothetical protein